MENSAIAKEIASEIINRKVYSRFDYILNHILVFLTIITSSFAGFAQLFDYKDANVIAAVAATPAFILLLQKTFKWEQRGEWHWDYRRRLIAIYREMRDQGLPSEEASKKLNQLEEQLAGSFPGLNTQASKEE